MDSSNKFESLSELTLRPDHLSSHQSRQNIKSQQTSSNKNIANRVFCKKLLFRRVPIIEWLPRYNVSDAIGDLIAGITVALTAIPLALAFANIAHLPIETALYSSFACNFVYTIFGSCKDNILGSTAIASLLTYEATHGSFQKALTFTFLSGLVEIFLLGLCRLSFVIDFFSVPVSAGFTSAIALIIFTSQFKDILVINSSGNSFLQNWISMVQDIHNYRKSDTLLGIGCVVVLLILRYIGNIKIKQLGNAATTRIINNFFWFLGVSRNALIVLICASCVAYLESRNQNFFILVGFIPSGFPSMQVPPFSIEAVVANETIGLAEVKAETFINMVNDFGANLIVIPLIAVLETIAVCKTFANGKSIDISQEVFTLGLANVVNSFFLGYRVNGGLARGSVNTASGGRTPLVNIYVGGIVILAMLYFAKYFYFIPKAVLAAIIISAVVFQLQYQVIAPMWRSKKSDLLPYFVTIIACLLLPLTLGVALAVVFSLLFILYHSARPKVMVESLNTAHDRRFLKITPDRCLIFPSAEFIRNLIQKSGSKVSLPVVIDCTYVYGADFTAAKVITSMIEDFERRHQKIIFYNLKPSVSRVFEGVNINLVLCYKMDCLEKILDCSIPNGVSTINISDDTEQTRL